MKLTKLLLALFILSMSAFFACQKDLSAIDEPVLGNDNTPNITTSITGRIVDETNKPVQGATIQVGANTTITNVNGEFTLRNVRAYDRTTYVQVKKQGYFAGSRTLITRNNSMHYVEVKLLSSAVVGTVNAATGGTVTLTNGTAVTLPAAGVVNAATNAAYTGTVNVSMAWIDPTSADLGRQMPGDLRGINLSGAEMGMESFGMVAVELKSDAGEKLQIAAGKKATVKFFLPATITSAAPADIPLWSFDEAKGLWKQEGTATKSGNFYTAEVSHFSFWNCDAQFPTVELTATIKDQNGQPMRHKLVKIKRTTTNGVSYGTTDSAGVVKGLVPQNEALILEVRPTYQCGTVIHSENIGPFASAANINVTVTTVTNQYSTITGTATNCTGGNVANGSAELIINMQTYRTAVVNGAFSFSIYTCSNNATGTLIVTDSATNQQSAPATLAITTGANNAGSISACGVAITQFINYTLNGTSVALAPPSDSLMAWNTQQGITQVSGFSRNSNANYINFSFSGNAVGAGNITNLNLSTGTGYAWLQQGTSLPATITEYGPVGGYVAGNFSGNVRDSLNTSIPMQCSFRVRRSQ